MQIYSKLNEITVYIFFEIIKTDNYKLLIKSRKERSKEITENKLFELEGIFKDIIHEYSIKTQNFKIINNIKKRFIITKLESEREILKSVLDLFNKFEEIEVLFVLRSLGYDFINCDSIDDEVNKVIKRIKSLNNQISINKLRYENQNKKTDEGEKDYDLDLVALNLEKSLDLKYRIDIKKTTMLRWCNMIMLSKKQINRNG